MRENKSNYEEKAQMTGKVGKNETTTSGKAGSGTKSTALTTTQQQDKERKRTMNKLTVDLPTLSQLPPKNPTVNINENESRVSCHFGPEHGEGNSGSEDTTKVEGEKKKRAPAQDKETKGRLNKRTYDLPTLSKLPSKDPTVNINENESPEHGEGNSGSKDKTKVEGGKKKRAPAPSAPPVGAVKPKKDGGKERVTNPPKTQPNRRDAHAPQNNAQNDKQSTQNKSNKASATTSPPSRNRRSSSFSPGHPPPPPPPNNGKRTPAVRSSSNNAATTARTPSSTSPSATRSPTSQPQHGARPKKTK